MALTAPRNTESRGAPGRLQVLPVKESAAVFAGSLVAVDAYGKAEEAATSSAITAGVAQALSPLSPGTGSVTGDADGYAKVTVAIGVFKFDNDQSHPLDQADVLTNCYVYDGHTVGATGGSSLVAGTVEEIDADGGVWVRIGNG